MSKWPLLRDQSPINSPSSSALVHPLSGPPSRVNSPDVSFNSRPVSVASSMASTSPFLSRRTRTMESTPTLKSSVSEKYNLNPDFSYFLSPNHQEPDDQLHNPDRDSKGRIRRIEVNGTIFTGRGLANLGCVLCLVLILIGLFLGYPLAIHFTTDQQSNLDGFNLGGINSSGQVPVSKHFSLIDPETPDDALTYVSYHDGSEMKLVFSDEFNVENRTFWPGDDPYWEAVDLYYAQTGDKEWYSPWAITTRGGALEITFSAKDNHNLSYEGGMMSSWNKFCFTGGLIMASIRLPGRSDVSGFWPAVWTMGNLGRAGYGASLDGMWPYSYDACDVGTLRNQSLSIGNPENAWVGGDHDHAGQLSALPGQRLSRCTCKTEDHPGPVHGEDGTFVGRASPEIDVIEAQVDGAFPGTGAASQSGQWAPFNAQYAASISSTTQEILDPTVSHVNTFTGSWVQQATSVITNNNETGYELTGGTFQTYGFHYKPGYDDGYIAWMAGGKPSWTMHGATMAGDDSVGISARPVSMEPMYILMNLGMSKNFAILDFDHLQFPAKMAVDWVRVYQPKNSINIGCDPVNMPTADYIQRHLPAYTNPNLTNWEPNWSWPKNSLIDTC